MPTQTNTARNTRAKRFQKENGNNGVDSAPGPRKQPEFAPSPNPSRAPYTVFRKLFESGKNNDFDAMADTIADDCEWVLMSNMTSFKGKEEVVALCKAGKLTTEKTPEITFDVATPEWGVFEYINRGVISESLSKMATASGWQSPADSSGLVGRNFEVPVCFVYHVNSQGKIYLLREYLDLASLMEQFK